MPTTNEPQTVLVFKEIVFIGPYWTRSNAGGNVIVYTTEALGGGGIRLVVLVETSAGTNVTHVFELNTNQVVLVCYGGDAQVHIPAIATKILPGNQMKVSLSGFKAARVKPARRKGR